eukprot:GHRR01003319.1.p2 GENE.GHRR01003319.1~~GHRR01003319.1.p2  ORF type:complete len:774 (+),score=289.52 GHRR01003319.1:119-2323(+)
MASRDNSYILQREAAAAFAAAAAAQALMPQHALPELLDSSQDDGVEDNRWQLVNRPSDGLNGIPVVVLPGSRLDGILPADHPLGYDRALSEALQYTGVIDGIASSSNCSLRDYSRKRQKTRAKANRSNDNGSASFTWHEFLSTVAAIDHPHIVWRQQQQQKEHLTSDRVRDRGLGPIAEGVQTASASGSVSGAASRSPYRSSTGAASLSGSIATAPAAAKAPKPPTSPRPALCSSRNMRSVQQLAVDDLDSKLQSLGFPQAGADEPATPCLMGNGQGAKAIAAVQANAAGALRPGTAPDSSSNSQWHEWHDADGSGFEVNANGEAAQGRHEALSRGQPAAESSSGSEIDGSKPPGGTNHHHQQQHQHQKDPNKRVLFSSEDRNDSLAAPASSGHYNPNSTLGHPGMGSSYPSTHTLGFDNILELPSAGTSTAGGQALQGRAAHGGDLDVVSLLSAGGGLLVEPSVTAKAIKRRKAAGAVTFAAEPAADVALPGGVEDCSATSASNSKIQAAAQFLDQVNAADRAGTAVVESSAPSETHSQASGTGPPAHDKRLSRSLSTGSEGAYSDMISYIGGGVGLQSGNWSVSAGGTTRHKTRTFPELAGTSLFMFKENTRFRKKLYRLVISRYFDYFMFMFIILNCATMAYEYPYMSKENLDGAILFWSDVVFTIVFSIESLLKVVAFGFKPYLGFFQNQVDFVIVVSSLAMLFLDFLNLEIVKVGRGFCWLVQLRAGPV